MTIEQIRAALRAATDPEERARLIGELEAAVRAAGNGEQPTEIEQTRSQVNTLQARRDTLISEIEQITVGAVDENDQAREYTPEEAEQRGRLSAQLEQVRADLSAREDHARQLEEAAREQRAAEQIAQMRRELGLTAEPNSVGGGTYVVSEPRTYEAGNGNSYLLDFALANSSVGRSMGIRSVQAAARLQRHGQENHVIGLEADERIGRMEQEKRERELRGTKEGYFLRQMIEIHNERDMNRGPIAERGLNYRALSTASSAGGEFVPPMYLTEQWIAYARPGRVLADLQHQEDLPDGTMSINIPKVTSGTLSATQGTQNTNTAMADLQTTFVTFPVVTKAGSQIVSLQLLERSPVEFDQIVGRDLSLAYAQDVNTSVHSGTGTAPSGGTDIVGILNTSGVNIVTWTQASPTIKGLYGQIGLAKLDVATGRKLPATHQVLSASCWEWIAQTFDSSNRPLVVPQYNGPFNAVAVADEAVAGGVVGRNLQMLDTYEDLTLPTNLGSGSNQDVDIVGRFDENYLYESPVTMRMLPQTYGLQLSELIQLYGYVAFTAARFPSANSVITGTGMSSANRTFNS